jgi:hypothetical protein
MEELIHKVLSRNCFLEQPPILVDIGASGQLPLEWHYLSAYSIGIAFDADNREFKIEQTQEDNNWKKLYKLNRLVVPLASETVDFYLTESPYCSSSLMPDKKALEPWLFRELFEVVEKTSLPGINLKSILDTVNIDKIDWYKTDSQGTDLRIFSSLPQNIIENVLVADFEPGIIDAYLGEDKLYKLMEYMDHKPFWVSDMEIKGSYRVYSDQLKLRQIYLLHRFLKTSPGWCEISYLNTFENLKQNERNILLGWVFSTIKQQHGFALYLANLGQNNFDEALFNELLEFSQKKLSLKLSEQIFYDFKKTVKKIFRILSSSQRRN